MVSIPQYMCYGDVISIALPDVTNSLTSISVPYNPQGGNVLGWLNPNLASYNVYGIINVSSSNYPQSPCSPLPISGTMQNDYCSPTNNQYPIIWNTMNLGNAQYFVIGNENGITLPGTQVNNGNIISLIRLDSVINNPGSPISMSYAVNVPYMSSKTISYNYPTNPQTNNPWNPMYFLNVGRGSIGISMIINAIGFASGVPIPYLIETNYTGSQGLELTVVCPTYLTLSLPNTTYYLASPSMSNWDMADMSYDTNVTSGYISALNPSNLNLTSQSNRVQFLYGNKQTGALYCCNSLDQTTYLWYLQNNYCQIPQSSGSPIQYGLQAAPCGALFLPPGTTITGPPSPRGIKTSALLAPTEVFGDNSSQIYISKDQNVQTNNQNIETKNPNNNQTTNNSKYTYTYDNQQITNNQTNNDLINWIIILSIIFFVLIFLLIISIIISLTKSSQ